MKKHSIFSESNFEGYIGVAELDVTPPVGIYARNWGAAEHDQSIGNHNSLKITCITLSENLNNNVLILISMDACVWRSFALRKKIFDTILNKFSIPKENLAFCLTHTHAGPVLSDELGDMPGGELNNEYLEILQQQIIKVIGNSLNNRSLSIITWKYGKCSLAKNRDLFLEEKNCYVTGFNPALDADDTLVVGRIFDVGNKIIKGVIVNYACHPTTLAWTNKLVSADYVGEMREYIDKELNCPVLFIQGASGELAPQCQYTDDLKVVKSNGKILAYSVLSVLEQMIPAGFEMFFKKVVPSGADLAEWGMRQVTTCKNLSAHIEDVNFKLKDIPSQEQIMRQINSSISRVEKEKLFRLKNLRVQFGSKDIATIGVWIWQIGDAIFVGQQNEAYSDFQTQLRCSFSSKCVLVGNLVNGSAGYLPPRKLYNEDCYTVKQTPFAAGGLENLIDETISFIHKIDFN